MADSPSLSYRHWAYAAPLAKPIAPATIDARNGVHFLLPHA